MTDNRISLTLTFASDAKPAIVATRVGDVVATEVAAPLIGMNWHGFSLTEDEADHVEDTDWRRVAEDLEAERDGAYRERAYLVALLAAMTDGAVIAPAPDVDEPGWQIVYLYVGAAQCSWHISPRDADLFVGVEHVAADDPRAQWDGHTTETKYEHLAAWTAELAQRCGLACSEMHTETGRCELARARTAEAQQEAADDQH